MHSKMNEQKESEVHSDVVSNSIGDDIETTEIEDVNNKIRATFFTLNNPTDDDKMRMLHIINGKEDSRYLVYQLEKGKDGTPHFQGFFYFYNQVKLKTLNKILPRAHFMKPKCIKACILYCKKERTRVEGPFEIGKCPAQGQRTDLEDMAKKFLTLKIDQFVDEFPMEYVKYNRGLKALKEVTQKHRTAPPTVIWLWGPSGVNKTRTPFEKHIDSVYIKDGTHWWDNYNQEEAIIIDDFDGKWPFRDLLRLLDRYPYQGQTKGSYVKINSPYIYITCEYPPEEYWQDNELAQVMRRLTKVERMGLSVNEL